VLRNSLISNGDADGLLFGILLAGTVVIETGSRARHRSLRVRGESCNPTTRPSMGFTVYAGVVFGIVNLVGRYRPCGSRPARDRPQMSTALDVLRKLLRDPPRPPDADLLLLV